MKIDIVKLLDRRLSVRDFDLQVAEIQIRTAILNGFTAIGISGTVAVASIRLGSGETRPHDQFLQQGPL